MHGRLWKEATQEGESLSRHRPARVQLRCAAASPRCSPPARLANSSARGAESQGESTEFPPEPAGAELSPHREASRRLVLSCRRSLNSITLSFGRTCERNSQQYHTSPQGSKHYLDERMI